MNSSTSSFGVIVQFPGNKRPVNHEAVRNGGADIVRLPVCFEWPQDDQELSDLCYPDFPTAKVHD